MTHDFWYLSRAAGVTAYVLLAASVILGLLLSTRLAGRLGGKAATADLHKFISLLAVVVSVAHAVVLLGDGYIDFTIKGLTVPLASPYRPLATAAGVVAMYGIAIVTASFYVRRRIGFRAWRAIHYSTFGLLGLVTLHGLAAGTDSGHPLIQLMYATTVGATMALVVVRMSQSQSAKESVRDVWWGLAGGAAAGGLIVMLVMAGASLTRESSGEMVFDAALATRLGVAPAADPGVQPVEGSEHPEDSLAYGDYDDDHEEYEEYEEYEHERHGDDDDDDDEHEDDEHEDDD